MSLRDYFAAQALQGILANQTRTIVPSIVAQFAFEYADRMLWERNKQ